MAKRKRRFEHIAEEIVCEAPRSEFVPKDLKPKTEQQKRYLNAINTNQLVFGLGPAGTGKTYIAAARACELLLNNDYEKLIVTRPAIEVGRGLGFLPGDVAEKFDPYFAPVREVFYERIGKAKTESFIRSGRIVVTPLNFMRGHTLNAIVLLDEAQNTTPVEMKMFLTRIGDYSKFIVNGDLSQKDIPGKSGLEEAVELLDGVKSVSTVTFAMDDIVRSGLVRSIIYRYNGFNDAPASGLPSFISGRPD